MQVTNRKQSLLLVAILLLCGAADALAQGGAQAPDFVEIRPKLNSPLSRLGGGNPLDQFHAVNAGMGGIITTYQDPFHLNIQNPASLASLAATSFELGVYGRISELEDRTGVASTNQGNLRYLALGFPLRNPINLNLDRQDNTWNGGMAFSLSPTTLVGYDLLLLEDEEPGAANNILRGDGGAYRFTWSTAARYRTLSAGVNVNYNFGKVTNSRVVTFDGPSQILASELREESSLGGFNFGYGLQYAYEFKENNDEGVAVPNGKRILLGLSGQFGKEVESEESRILRRFGSGLVTVSDTLEIVEGRVGSVTLPAAVNVGVAFEDYNRLYVGVEFGANNTSAYTNTARRESLLDANRLAFGIQYIPNNSSYNSYWKRVRYRFGVRLEDDPRSLEGTQARRNAVTVGAGLPLRLPRNQVSFIDMAVELGQFGVPDVLDENYVQFTLGFSLNDNSWFFKRKLN